jgi:hypothetical protein
MPGKGGRTYKAAHTSHYKAATSLSSLVPIDTSVPRVKQPPNNQFREFKVSTRKPSIMKLGSTNQYKNK